MAFKRLWNGNPGKLSDAELEHLMSLVRRGSAIMAAWSRFLAEGPPYDRDHPKFKELIGNVRVELKKLSTAIYPHTEWADLVELEIHLEAET